MNAESSQIDSSIEHINDITRKIRVKIPKDEVDRSFESKLGDLSRTLNIKGFRKGKAPRAVVEKMHGPRIRYEVVNDLISSSLNSVLESNKLPVIGSPEIDVASFEPGKALEYTAEVVLYPDPEVKAFEALEVTVEPPEVKDEDVQKVIEMLRQQKATTRKNEFRNVVKEGDVVDIVVKITKEGESEPIVSEPIVIPLGKERLPQEIEKGLLGMEIGQNRKIEAPLPNIQTEQAEALKATWEITLNNVLEEILPELNDEFVKGLGAEKIGTVLELRMKIREDLEAERKSREKMDVIAKLMDHLIDSNDFMLPQQLVDDTLRRMLVQANLVRLDRGERGSAMDFDLEPFRKDFEEHARKRLKGNIIIDKIAQNQQLKLSEDDIKGAIERLQQYQGVSAEELKKLTSNRDFLNSYMGEILREKTLDALFEKVSIKYDKLESNSDKGKKKSKKEAGAE
jgi:trigger factor